MTVALSGPGIPVGTRALVLTVSDGVADGTREDESGRALGDRLAIIGFHVDRQTVPDDRILIEGGRATGETPEALERRIRAGLVVVQIALAVTLLCASGRPGRSSCWPGPSTPPTVPASSTAT